MHLVEYRICLPFTVEEVNKIKLNFQHANLKCEFSTKGLNYT